MKNDKMPISSFVACAVAEGLKEFIKEKRIIPNKIPPAVIPAAIDFLNCAAEATLPKIPINPVKTAKAYCLAMEIILGIHKFKSREKMDRRLQIYTFLMEKTDFQSSCQIFDRNIQLFQELVKFFEKLQQITESKIFERFYQGSFGDSDDE